MGHEVYKTYKVVKGKLHPAGRFMIQNDQNSANGGQISHLENYYDMFRDIPEGPVNEAILDKIANPGADMKIASESAIKNGLRYDVVPEAELEPLPPQPPKIETQPVQNPPVFHYTRAGFDNPHVLEVHDKTVLLDGQPLSEPETATVLANVRNKSAKLRYAKLTKAIDLINDNHSETFKKLALAERLEKMSPEEALAHLDSLKSEDPKTQEAIAAMRQHLFEDPVTPGLGNQRAYLDFREKNPQGTWVSMDVNNLKHLNDTAGHEAGTNLIRAFGAAARKGADPNKSKLFRAGGDEFVLHAPTSEDAFRAVRQIRNHVEQIPPLGGTHKVSFSAGLGNSFEDADSALYKAKAQKLNGPGGQPHPKNNTPTFIHSHVPNAVGPVK